MSGLLPRAPSSQLHSVDNWVVIRMEYSTEIHVVLKLARHRWIWAAKKKKSTTRCGPTARLPIKEDHTKHTKNIHQRIHACTHNQVLLCVGC